MQPVRLNLSRLRGKRIPDAKLGKEWRFRKSIIDEWFLQHIDEKFDYVIESWKKKQGTNTPPDPKKPDS